MINRRILFIAFIALTLAIPATYAQDVTPKSLNITVYSDGVSRIDYNLEADPSRVRVEVELLGPPFSSLVVRDEEGNPLAYTVTDANITIDSIGALELNIQYLTSSLTVKEGSLWTLNLTAPAETRITLPLGAAIVDLLSLPTSIGSIDGKPYVEFEPGNISLYYIIGVPSIVAEADEAISAAESYITEKTLEGYVVEAVASTLNQAKTYYQEGSYLDAKNQAEAALRLAQETVYEAESAKTAIQLAESAISNAKSEGRTVGLDPAESLYETSISLYDEGEYAASEDAAHQAYQLAIQAEAGGENITVYALGVFVLALTAGAYLYLKRGRGASHPDLGENIVIDLDRILGEHDLRLEDREVLRYIVESNGEVFASDIRERFKMPRSTAWRLIKRLKGLEIIDEVKVGNQSLIRINPKYRKN